MVADLKLTKELSVSEPIQWFEVFSLEAVRSARQLDMASGHLCPFAQHYPFGHTHIHWRTHTFLSASFMPIVPCIPFLRGYSCVAPSPTHMYTYKCVKHTRLFPTYIRDSLHGTSFHTHGPSLWTLWLTRFSTWSQTRSPLACVSCTPRSSRTFNFLPYTCFHTTLPNTNSFSSIFVYLSS